MFVLPQVESRLKIDWLMKLLITELYAWNKNLIMKCINKTIAIESRAYQLKEITQEVKTILESSRIKNGLATVFCKHTSCSLVIMENADPSASKDLEDFICRLVPENGAYSY